MTPSSEHEDVAFGNLQPSPLAEARETSRRGRGLLATALGATCGPTRCAALLLAALLPLSSGAQVNQGRFTHRIPIKIPIGTHGMEPSLALVYDSGNGNGILGMGWSLAGLSSIARCNYGNGINYVGADTYCHSNLGVLVRQPDGSYRSKKESFTKLVPSGNCGDGPCSWVAYDRSGLQSWYGATADSALMSTGAHSGAVRTWGLSRVTDLFGNFYSITYTNDAANGTLYPAQIDYTFGPGVANHRTIQLQYEGRQDAETSYAQGAYTAMWWRLKWIIVKSACSSSSCSEGSLLRQYRLDYRCGAGLGCQGSETGRSRLDAVTEYGNDGKSTLPAQTFGWQQPASSGRFFPPSAPSAFFDGAYDGAPVLVDLNQDGFSDLVAAIGWVDIAYLLTTSDGNRFRSWGRSIAFELPAALLGWDFNTHSWFDRGVRIVDLNGDGRRTSCKDSMTAAFQYSMPG